MSRSIYVWRIIRLVFERGYVTPIPCLVIEEGDGRPEKLYTGVLGVLVLIGSGTWKCSDVSFLAIANSSNQSFTYALMHEVPAHVVFCGSCTRRFRCAYRIRSIYVLFLFHRL